MSLAGKFTHVSGMQIHTSHWHAKNANMSLAGKFTHVSCM